MSEDERRAWEDVDPGTPHVWHTLGYRRALDEPGRMVIEWDATEHYAFPAESGAIVHGGLVATILDSAMGGACWTLLEGDETFLTAELRTEFHRAARPGQVGGCSHDRNHHSGRQGPGDVSTGCHVSVLHMK